MNKYLTKRNMKIVGTTVALLAAVVGTRILTDVPVLVGNGQNVTITSDVVLQGRFGVVTVSGKGNADNLISVDCAGATSTRMNLSGTYIDTYDCDVAGDKSFGVFITGSNITFRDSKVHNTVTDNGVTKCTGNVQWGSGVKVYAGASNVVISGNEVYQNCGEGIAATRGAYVTIANNIVYDNFSVDIYIDNSHHVTVQNNHAYYTSNTNYYRGGAVGSGILLGSEYYAGWGDQLHDIWIDGNTIQHAKGIRLYTQVGTKTLPSATISNNIFIQVAVPFVNVPGALITNNTVATVSPAPTSIRTPSLTPTLATSTATQPGPIPMTTTTPTRTVTPTVIPTATFYCSFNPDGTIEMCVRPIR